MAIEQETNRGLRELALFAGAGGGILGGHLLGWRTVCVVEWDAYAASVLVARQNDGCLPPFPVWDDVQTFDGRPWQGRVDVVSGGFPCQDISCAGKGAGITGERSGMWKHMARIIGEVRPRFAFVENSPLLVGRGLGAVLADLAEMGYDAKWGIVGAHHTGAPHKRDRIWILATYSAQLFRDGEPHNERSSLVAQSISELGDSSRQNDVADSNIPQRQGAGQPNGSNPEYTKPDSFGAWWRQDPAEIPESGVGRVANGVAHRMDRLRCIGNGQVPACVRLAWQLLSKGF